MRPPSREKSHPSPRARTKATVLLWKKGRKEMKKIFMWEKQQPSTSCR